jgi:hypothetical protein
MIAAGTAGRQPLGVLRNLRHAHSGPGQPVPHPADRPARAELPGDRGVDRLMDRVAEVGRVHVTDDCRVGADEERTAALDSPS